MFDIRLIRLDFRLIHGQVITKWFGQITGNEIVREFDSYKIEKHRKAA